MKELPQPSLASESFPKKAARFVLKKAIHALPASALLFAACSGGSAAEKNNNQELKDKESSGYSLPFPEGETWFLTNGPHADGWSNGVRYAIDIAPPEGGFCPPDGKRFTIDNRVVTASASGKVMIKGRDWERNDPDHSVIHIKGKHGLTQIYIHLDRTQVKLGDKVKKGDPLGNPSCEYPPGGANTGPHVHVGLIKDGQAIPIDGTIIGGWTIHENGTMTKPGEKTRTANVGRYADESGEIRNDLPNNSNRAVVALPKDPIPPISGKAISKEVFTAPPPPAPTAIPTPKPTETPKPVVEKKASLSKTPEDLYRALLTTSIPDGILPQNVTLKEKSAGNVDDTARALKAIGQINILLLDKNVLTVFDNPNGAISYTIFPDAPSAKSAYLAIVNSTNSATELKDFAFPALVFFSPWLAGPTFIMAFENVLVRTVIAGPDAATHKKEAVILARAASEHLKKVGR